MSADSSIEKPAAFSGEDEFSKYLLTSRSEVLYNLRALVQRGAMITAYFNHGQDFLLTSLIEVDADADLIHLDTGSNAAMNRKILDADRVQLVTSLDRVRIQFHVDGVDNETHEGRPALVANLPHEILRIQRRDSYRLTLPIATPVRCTMQAEHQGKNLDMEASIYDISVGGAGISLASEDPHFESGDIFRKCRFSLPDAGDVTADLIIRSRHELRTRTGARHMRYGCEFIKPSVGLQALIQRYITKVERERKARESGLE